MRLDLTGDKSDLADMVNLIGGVCRRLKTCLTLRRVFTRTRKQCRMHVSVEYVLGQEAAEC